jgi:metal-sulfur cluster biosynthetic enzyme
MEESRKPEASVDAETPHSGGPETSPGPDAIREQVIEALRSVYDPEIPVNIYELGLIYEVQVERVTSVAVELVWDPPWSPDMMSEAARLDLGMV